MSRRGRPRSPRAASAQVIHTKLRLYPGEDDDLIGFFANIPPGLKAGAIKRALRSGIQWEDKEEQTSDEWLGDLAAFVE